MNATTTAITYAAAMKVANSVPTDAGRFTYAIGSDAAAATNRAAAVLDRLAAHIADAANKVRAGESLEGSWVTPQALNGAALDLATYEAHRQAWNTLLAAFPAANA
ncbi:hypothetical protein [Parafrankia discariae]|uniref:hypothetical protein n=1 Tax=Parafrankia discariae TaxID=365528 RepID=UPI00036A8EF4|nr:hypothetical protein [Parafrankia discariae]